MRHQKERLKDILNTIEESEKYSIKSDMRYLMTEVINLYLVLLQSLIKRFFPLPATL